MLGEEGRSDESRQSSRVCLVSENEAEWEPSGERARVIKTCQGHLPDGSKMGVVENLTLKPIRQTNTSGAFSQQ